MQTTPCTQCEGVGRIPQRGFEATGSREVCPSCNGTGSVSVPAEQAQADQQAQANEAAPKGDGSTDSSGGPSEPAAE